MAQPPSSLAAALAALAAPGAMPIAGGTDWFPTQGDKPFRGPLVDIRALPGFQDLRREGEIWRLGACLRWTDLIRADLPPGFSALKEAAREVGSVQVQNAGTVAGNLCNASPAADGVPVLLALGAEVELVSVFGRRVLALADFITGPRRTALRPGELLSAVLLPDPGVFSVSVFLKAGGRRYLVISVAMVAVVLRADHGLVAAAGISVGSCGPVACRLAALEAALIGRRLDDLPRVTQDHLAPLTPISDLRASAEYRREAAGVLVSRAMSEAARRLQ